MKFTVLSLAILACLVSYQKIEATPCSSDNQCNAVSFGIGYAKCVSGQCACSVDYGFFGNATPGSKCTCPYQTYSSLETPKRYFCKSCLNPRKIYRDGKFIPYCVDLKECEDSISQKTQQERNKDTIARFYNSIVRPKNFEIIFTPGVPEFFTDDVYGRFTPVGTFHGEAVKEYFYGLTLTVSYVRHVYIIETVAEDNKVFVRADIEVQNIDNSGLVRNITQTGRFTFNSDAKITNFDLVNLNLGACYDNLDKYKDKNFNIYLICTVHTNNCTGSLQQYDSFNHCVSVLSQKPLGSFNRLNSDTVLCRIVHAVLTTVDPQMHCAHISENGGMKCVDFAYESFYDRYY